GMATKTTKRHEKDSVLKRLFVAFCVFCGHWFGVVGRRLRWRRAGHLPGVAGSRPGWRGSLLTVKRTVSDPCTTQWGGGRATRPRARVGAPVGRLWPRIWTMLAGRRGRALPPTATPEGPTGTRSTRSVRLTPVCRRSDSMTWATLVGLF